MTQSPTPTGQHEAPPLNYTARLALTGDLDESPLMPGSWFISHGLGKAAQNTFTEVAFAPDLRDQPEIVLDEVVRRVAVELYGTAWAFTYRPDQYEDAIARHGLRRRERVIVTSIEVWS